MLRPAKTTDSAVFLPRFLSFQLAHRPVANMPKKNTATDKAPATFTAMLDFGKKSVGSLLSRAWSELPAGRDTELLLFRIFQISDWRDKIRPQWLAKLFKIRIYLTSGSFQNSPEGDYVVVGKYCCFWHRKIICYLHLISFPFRKKTFLKWPRLWTHLRPIW